MAEGVDYSWARPGGAALAAAGKSFVVRYLYPGGGKGLTAAETADLRAHGLSIATVYEDSGTEARGGRAAGIAAARAAQGQLADAGLPDTQFVYFATDWDVQTSEFATVDAFLDGAASVLGRGRIGIYGGLSIIQHVQSNGKAAKFWQTYAWSGGRVASNIHLYQYLNGQILNGGSVDLCRNLAADFGGFGGAVSASANVAVGSNISMQSTSWVQQRLNAYGYSLTVDGIYGPATTATVKAFQTAHGLTVDGIVGPQTVAALTAEPIMKLPVDGIWGPLTTKALQTALGVTVDGIVGPQTITALQKRLGIPADGINGPQTHTALQAKLGVAQDGIWGPATTKALQTALNTGGL